MRVMFAPEARQEFEEAERYYNQQWPALGNRFREEVRPRCLAYAPGRYPAPRNVGKSGGLR